MLRRECRIVGLDQLITVEKGFHRAGSNAELGLGMIKLTEWITFAAWALCAAN